MIPQGRQAAEPEQEAKPGSEGRRGAEAWGRGGRKGHTITPIYCFLFRVQIFFFRV